MKAAPVNETWRENFVRGWWTGKRQPPHYKDCDLTRFGGWIRAYLKDHDMTLQMLAERSGVSLSTIESNIYRQNKIVKPGFVKIMSRAMALLPEQESYLMLLAAKESGYVFPLPPTVKP